MKRQRKERIASASQRGALSSSTAPELHDMPQVGFLALLTILCGSDATGSPIHSPASLQQRYDMVH